MDPSESNPLGLCERLRGGGGKGQKKMNQVGLPGLRNKADQLDEKSKAALDLDIVMKRREKRTRRASRATKRRWIGAEPLPANVVQRMRDGEKKPQKEKAQIPEAKFDQKVGASG
jgi:hypothetical protein